jgi:hypothetical protein
MSIKYDFSQEIKHMGCFQHSLFYIFSKLEIYFCVSIEKQFDRVRYSISSVLIYDTPTKYKIKIKHRENKHDVI